MNQMVFYSFVDGQEAINKGHYWLDNYAEGWRKNVIMSNCIQKQGGFVFVVRWKKTEEGK